MDYFTEREEQEYQHGASLGDPRRCRRHPHVHTSSRDGVFDAPCYECEGEMEDEHRAYMRGLQLQEVTPEAAPTPPVVSLDDCDIPF